MTVDLARIAAICAEPYRTDVGSLRCAGCGRPLEREPGRRMSRLYTGGKFERPCRCKEAQAVA